MTRNHEPARLMLIFATKEQPIQHQPPLLGLRLCSEESEHTWNGWLLKNFFACVPPQRMGAFPVFKPILRHCACSYWPRLSHCLQANSLAPWPWAPWYHYGQSGNDGRRLPRYKLGKQKRLRQLLLYPIPKYLMVDKLEKTRLIPGGPLLNKVYSKTIWDILSRRSNTSYMVYNLLSSQHHYFFLCYFGVRFPDHSPKSDALMWWWGYLLTLPPRWGWSFRQRLWIQQIQCILYIPSGKTADCYQQ